MPLPRTVGTGRALLFAPPAAAAPPADPAINFESAGTFYNASGTSHVLGAPAGIQDGDLLVIVVVHSGTPTITPPAGFAAEAGFGLDMGAALTLRVYTKVASGEAGNYTVGTSATVTLHAQVYRVSGADTAAPIDAIGTVAGGSSATATATAISPTTAALLVGVVITSGTRDFSSAQMNETGDGSSAAFYWEELAASGSTGTRTFSISSSASWGAVLFAIKD